MTALICIASVIFGAWLVAATARDFLMNPSIVPAVSVLIGTLVGGGISYLLNRQQLKNQLEMLRERYKTEFMAETTARHYLMHEGYTDRSFEVLKKHLGGFDDDELRKILVRAGAVRVISKSLGTQFSL
jgi:hypothetical protein